MDLPGNDRLSYCQMKVGVAFTEGERESECGEGEGGIDCGLLVVVENEST